MHAEFRHMPALIIVLAPSTVSFLLGIAYHAYFKRTISRQREDRLKQAPTAPHRRGDFQSILLALGVATLPLALTLASPTCVIS
jgi:hypothetical protein